MIRETLKDLVSYVPSRIIPAIAAIVAVPALTRLLPPSEYGHFTLAVNASGLFTALVSSWITSSAIRFVPRYEEHSRLGPGMGLLVRMFVVSLAASGVVAGAGGLIVAESGFLPLGLVVVTVLLCVAATSQDFLLGLLRSRRRAATFTTLMSVSGTGSYALAVLMTWLLKPAAFTAVAAFLLAVLLVLPFATRKALAGITLEFSGWAPGESRELLRYGLPALVINALTWTTALSDRYVLAAAQSLHAAGIYAASRDLTDKGIVLLNTLFLLASTPVAMTVWERQGEQAAQVYVARLTRYYLLVALPLAVGLSVLAQPLIGVLADARYHEGYRLVPLVAAGAVLSGLATRYTLGLTFRKRTDLLSLAYLGAAILNVGLNVALVPRYGIMAAAAGNCMAFGTLLWLARAISRPLFAWSFPTEAAFRIACAAGAMGLLVAATRALVSRPGLQLALGAFVGVAAYAAALVALRVLTHEERHVLAQAFNWRRRPPTTPA